MNKNNTYVGHLTFASETGRVAGLVLADNTSVNLLWPDIPVNKMRRLMFKDVKVHLEDSTSKWLKVLKINAIRAKKGS